MDFSLDLEKGVHHFLNLIRSRLVTQPATILSIFRYWTAYAILEFIKTDTRFDISLDPHFLTTLGFPIDQHDTLPFLTAALHRPIPLFLLVALDTQKSPEPKTLLETAQPLLASESLFRYHVFLFSQEHHRFLVWDSHSFSLDSVRLVQISQWIRELCLTLDYHELTSSSTLQSFVTSDTFVMSTGPSFPFGSSKVVSHPLATPTSLTWFRMLPQLLKNVSLLPYPLHIVYPDMKEFSMVKDILSQCSVASAGLSSSISSNSHTPYPIPIEYEIKSPIRQETDLMKPFLVTQEFFNQVLLPPFQTLKKIFNKKHKMDFFAANAQDQKDLLNLWVPVAYFLIALQKIFQSTKGTPKYVLCLLPSHWKFFVDAMMFQLVPTSQTQLLIPNSNWNAFTVFVPFRLYDFPWLPNLLHDTNWWFLQAQTQAKVQKHLAKTKRVEDIEPLLSKDLKLLFLWNEKAKKSEQQITSP